MRGLELHTVCEEAHCPNLGECWSRGTATFMILGEVCTRACGFCAVKTGLPGRPPDPDEPRRVADAVARMGLRHAVVTSVNRDDQPDGGAGIFAATIRESARPSAGLRGRGAHPRLQGALGRPAGRAGRAPRHPQPQRRDRAAPLPPSAVGRQLPALARAAEAVEGRGAPDEERCHGRPRRGMGRDRGDDPGCPLLRDPTSSRSGSICAPRSSTCRSCATTPPGSSRRCAGSPSPSASTTSSPGRSYAPATTRSSTYLSLARSRPVGAAKAYPPANPRAVGLRGRWPALPRHHRADDVGRIIDVRLGGRSAEREA